MNKTRKESKLLKKFDKCKTRKCSTLIKKREAERAHFEKEQNLACPQKSAKAFYNCSSKFYNGSKLEKLSKDVVKCSMKKCKKQKMKLNAFRKTM
jgi:hypothetical protein